MQYLVQQLIIQRRKHAEAYIKANKNTPISSQTGQDIDCNLNAKGRLTRLKKWQFMLAAQEVFLVHLKP